MRVSHFTLLSALWGLYNAVDLWAWGILDRTPLSLFCTTPSYQHVILHTPPALSQLQKSPTLIQSLRLM